MGVSKRKRATGGRTAAPGQITRVNDDWTERLFVLAEANSEAAHAPGSFPMAFTERLFVDHELVVMVWNVGTRTYTYAAKGWRHYYAYARTNIPPTVATTALVVPSEQVARALAGIYGDGGPGGEDALPPAMVAEARARGNNARAMHSGTRQ